ncbi:MAG TPA: DUF488 family protein [Candidatus Limnocylindrales bacterium]|nr:DUF488 family protein [Candidatus Limnocylindrales bacterium]HZM10868.1 DUF488 family protein [Candidatus Limnocylindrales bacterium]
MTVALKRVYAAPSPQDGARVLVDRLWPRGLKKSDAALDAWLKDLAPSNELRKWFHAHPPQWSKFREKYLKELTTEAANTALQQLYELQKKRRRLTLLFASRNEERNNAVVLKQLVDGERKPPTGTGPIRAAASKRGRAARPR